MNLEQFLQERGIEYRKFPDHHHCTPDFIQFDCPRCSPNSGKFRLGWNIHHHYFVCWKCGKLPTQETWSSLSGLFGRVLQQTLKSLDSRIPISTVSRPMGNLELPAGLGPLKYAHRQYLLSRRLSPKQVEKIWNVKGIDHTNPQLAWRLFIPVIADDECVSWTTRAITDNTPKRYINARHDQEKYSLKNVLYGSDLCTNSIIVVEGPLDAWRIGPGAVATFGLAYTRPQLLQMAHFSNRIICLDSEPEAQKVAERLENDLLPFPGRTRRVVLDAKDPCSASDKEISKLRSLL